MSWDPQRPEMEPSVDRGGWDWQADFARRFREHTGTMPLRWLPSARVRRIGGAGHGSLHDRGFHDASVTVTGDAPARALLAGDEDLARERMCTSRRA